MTRLFSPLWLLASVWLVPDSAAAIQTPPGEASEGPAPALASKHGAPATGLSPAEERTRMDSVYARTSALGPPPVGHSHRHLSVKQGSGLSHARSTSNWTSPASTASTSQCATAFDQLAALFSDPLEESDLARRALFLGIGAGTGLATALNLTAPGQSDIIHSGALAEYGAESTANDLIAESVGKGLVMVLAPALGSSANTSSLTGTFGQYSATISEGFGRGLVGATVNFALQFFGNESVINAVGSAVNSGTVGFRGQSRAADSVQASNVTAHVAVSVLAQAMVNRLTCRGIGGLAEVVKNVVGNSSVVLSDMPINVVYEGNKFSLNLRDGSLVSNGLSSSTIAILTMAHAGFMLLAFFVAQPSLILLESLLTFHRLIGINELNTAKTNRYANMIHVIVLPTLVLAGLIFAVVASGSSGHFRTEHGIMGLIVVGIVPISSALGVLKRRKYLKIGIPVPAPFTTWDLLALGDASAHQVLLFFSSFLQSNGLEDLDSISLCLFVIEPDVLVSLVNSFAFFWNAAQTGITLEWWLGQKKGEWRKYVFFWRRPHIEIQEDDATESEKRPQM